MFDWKFGRQSECARPLRTDKCETAREAVGPSCRRFQSSGHQCGDDADGKPGQSDLGYGLADRFVVSIAETFLSSYQERLVERGSGDRRTLEQPAKRQQAGHADAQKGHRGRLGNGSDVNLEACAR